jgi:hypothetical protein
MILFPSILNSDIVSALPAGLRPDAAGTLSRVFLTPTGAARTAGPGNRVPRPDLMGRDRLPVHIPAVDTQDRRGSLAAGRHAHKPQSPGFIAGAAFYHMRGCHAAKWFKYLAQIAGGNVARQIIYADVHSISLFRCPKHRYFTGVLNPKEMMRETGS